MVHNDISRRVEDIYAYAALNLACTQVTITSPAPDASLPPAAMLSGTGEPGAYVHVFLDGTVSPVRTDAEGNWSLPVDNLAEGAHIVSAAGMQAGCPDAVAGPVHFTISQAEMPNPASPPPIPTGISPENGATVTTTRPTFSGRGVPGDWIQLCLPSIGICQTTEVRQDGTWSVTPEQSLPIGRNTVVITQISPLGVASAPIDTTVVIAPGDTGAVPPPYGISPPDGAIVTSGWQVLTGHGVPGYRVRACISPLALCSTVSVDRDGMWAIAPPTPFARGENVIIFTQINPENGNTSVPVESRLYVAY